MKTSIDNVIKVVPPGKPSSGGGQGSTSKPGVRTKTLHDQEPEDGTEGQGQEDQGQEGKEGQGQGKEGKEGPTVKTMSSDSIGKKNIVERGRMPSTGDVISPEKGQRIAKELGVDLTRPQTETDWKDMTRKAVQTHLTPRTTSAGRGNNGTIYQKIMELTEPKIDWREELARYIGDLSADSIFKIPARRWIDRGEYRRGKYANRSAIENAVVCLDVSGSIANSFPELAAEVVGIASAKEIETISVVPFADTVVDAFKVDNFRIPTPEDFEKVRTGGGSEAVPKVVKWIDEEAPNPEFVVIVTDGYLTSFEFLKDAPSWGLKTIWLIFDNPRFDVPESWGRVIHVNGEPGYWNQV